jgi:hypothetical protein
MSGQERTGGSENCEQSGAQGDKYYPGLAAVMGRMFDILMQMLGWDFHFFRHSDLSGFFENSGLALHSCMTPLILRFTGE